MTAVRVAAVRLSFATDGHLALHIHSMLIGCAGTKGWFAQCLVPPSNLGTPLSSEM